MDNSKKKDQKISNKKEKLVAQSVPQVNNWDEIDEYVMYDEMLYDEDE